MGEKVFQGYDYRIASLCVRSFMPLPALPADFDGPDVLISKGRVPDRLDNPIAAADWWQIGRDQSLLVLWEGRFRILLEEGSHIVVDVDSAMPDEGVLSFLMGPVFSAILIFRARLVFHGAAIAFGSRCVLFIGERGAGKSTMAGYFRLKGYPNLGDDLCTIGWDKDSPLVEPVFPWVKLREDTARFFRSGLGETTLARHGLDRFTLKPDSDLDPSPRRLAGIYLLDRNGELNGQDLATPLPRSRSFSWLYRNLYGTPLARHLGVFPRWIEQMTLVSNIPIYPCPRVSGLDLVERQVDFIIEKMRAGDV